MKPSILLASALVLLTACKPDVTVTEERVPPNGAANEAPSAPPKPAPRDKSDIGAPGVRVPVDGLPVLGNVNAPVTIVAFTDYECPYCYRADERIAQLRGEYGERVRLVIASHPLPMHDRASPAARAFLAAVEQGKGDAMHARLFSKDASLDDEGLMRAARDVGLDLALFDKARKGASTEAALRKAEAIGESLSVEGTPTFFVNGRRLVGARPLDAFRALIDEELDKAQSVLERGVAPSKLYDAILATLPEAPPPKAREAEGAEQVFDVGIEGAPLRGLARAPVTIVFFSDFECPFCVKAETTLRSLERQNPNKIRVAFRHRPLPMHPHARLAAKASIAADRQGRFWEYHDVLLAHRDALARDDLDRYAAQVGLDLVRFGRDLDDPALEARIAADEKAADTLGVKGTPTAFVNGRRIVGAQPIETWMGVMERSLAHDK